MEQKIELRLIGIAASPGIAVGAAHCLHDIPQFDPVKWERSGEGDPFAELATLEEAVSRTAAEIKEIGVKVSNQLGKSEAKIFQVHLSILHDQTLLEKVRRRISDRGFTSLAALNSVASEYDQIFANVNDDYIKERATDLRDVLQRLGKHMTKTDTHFGEPINTPMILVVDQLLPSDVLAITEHDVLGIVTQSGGRTSHAAILARSYGIPSVAGVAGILQAVTSGDSMVVDGRAGEVFVHPRAATKQTYETRRNNYDSLRDRIADQSFGPIQTADGTVLELMANVSCVDDAVDAARDGASGIGLYRTEFYFLTHPRMPSEEEQIAEYQSVIDAGPGGSVTIRTLDLGGDKLIPYLTHSHELNPIMGSRSVRLSLAHPEFFLQQIRSAFRVANQTERVVRLMFPMVTSWEELEQIRGYVAEAKIELQRRDVPFGDVAIGVMIEVPAAAVMIDQLIESVDFVSIGSNDLVQYLNAADRDNAKVNHLCQALSPAVIRVLRSVIAACRAAGKDVSVCGEMAGSPRAFPVLLGMGLRTFSMSPAFIPMIRDLARHVTLSDSERLLGETLKLRTPAEIQRLLDDYIAQVCPDAVPWLLS